MSGLPESIAVILGASTFPKSGRFEEATAFQRSADAIRGYLLHNGVTDERLLWLFDTEDQPGQIIRRMAEFFKPVDRAIRNVLVYFVGHGADSPHDGRDYILALRCTDQHSLEMTTLPVRLLARTLFEQLPDKRHIIILDACFAAKAVGGFQDGGKPAASVLDQVREVMPNHDIERGTTLFCAAGPKAKARASGEEGCTMFTGALHKALIEGDPNAGESLSLARVGELVEANIRAAFRDQAVRPEIHTPRQEKGDIRTLPLFPNPACAGPDSPRLRELTRRVEDLESRLRGFATELDWERASRARGWYEILEKRVDINPFGDVFERNRIVCIHAPEDGEIRTLEYGFTTSERLGVVVMDRIVDEYRGASKTGAALPPPGPAVGGTLELKPPATPRASHRGFTVTTTMINAFAMTTRDAEMSKTPPKEWATIHGRLPVRHLRLVVFFPPGYEPVEPPQIVAHEADDLRPSRESPENPQETARAEPGVFYDRARGCVLFHVPHALPRFRYALEWNLPQDPGRQKTEAVLAREQVRGLLTLSRGQSEWLDAAMKAIRDEVCARHFELPAGRRGVVQLSLFVFDDDKGLARVVASTIAPDAPKVALPWGAGVVGWAMRRRRPIFVDTRSPATAGIYRPVQDLPMDRYVLCVPLPLPSGAPHRRELLLDRATPCAVAALSCVDDSGNMERLSASEAPAGALPPVEIVAEDLVSSVSKILDGLMAKAYKNGPRSEIKPDAT